MKLTKKCKESFITWMCKNYPEIKWHDYETMPECVINSFIIEFFDSVGIYISIHYEAFGNHYFNVMVTRNHLTTNLRTDSISRTEDWLLKFGFNYDDMEDTFEDYNPWYHLVYDGFRFSSDKSVNFESVFIQLNKKTIEIKHVHQLQNLYFALTGCELEIK